MADRELNGGAATHAEADHVGLLDAEVGEQGGRVVGDALVADRPVGVGGAAVRLRVEGDDLAVRGQVGQQRPEVTGRHVGAVQQQHRGTGVRSLDAVDLVVHPEPVDLRVPGLRDGGRGIGHVGSLLGLASSIPMTTHPALAHDNRGSDATGVAPARVTR